METKTKETKNEKKNEVKDMAKDTAKAANIARLYRVYHGEDRQKGQGDRGRTY